jgi:hypothetical protein
MSAKKESSVRENHGKSITHGGTAFALLSLWKGGAIMRLHLSIVGLFLAGLLLGNPTQGLANDEFLRPTNPEINATHEKVREFPSIGSTQQRNMAEPSEIAAVDSIQMASVDYCYRGSVVDPVTGEMVDFFVLCTEGEVGHGLDIA